MYINTQTMQRVSEGEIRAAFPNTSFAVPFSPPDGYAVLFNSPVPSYDPKTQGYRETTPVQIDGKWWQAFEVYELDSDAMAAVKTQQEQAVRSTRNSLLSQSDWTQVADAPVDKAVWATYRQALRDITAQVGFPFEVVWPVAP